jgi:hypothetical protein
MTSIILKKKINFFFKNEVKDFNISRCFFYRVNKKKKNKNSPFLSIDKKGG